LKRENAQRRNANKELQDQIAELNARLEDNSKVASLERELEQVRPAVEREKAAREALDSLVNAQISNLSEPVRQIVERLPLDSVGKASWLQDALPVLQKQVAPSLGAADGSLSRSSPELTSEDREAMAHAERRGQAWSSPEEYLQDKLNAVRAITRAVD